MKTHAVGGSYLAWQIGLVTLLMMVTGSTSTRAAVTATWSGASNSSWQVIANWNPSTACPSNTNDKATFNSDGNGRTNVTITGTIILGGNAKQGLVFDTPNAAAYTISGGTIAAPDRTDYLVVVNPSVVNTQTVNSALTPTSFNNQDGGIFENYSPVAALTLGGGLSHTPVSYSGSNMMVFAAQGTISVPSVISDGPSNQTAIGTVRNGTTTLSGVNTFSGICFNSGSLSYNVLMGLASTLVLDYSTMAVANGTNTTTVLPNGTSFSFGDLAPLSGTVVLRGVPDPSVVTAQTFGKFRMTRGQTTFVLDRNGGAGVHVTLSTNWSISSGSSTPAVSFDLSSGGGVVRLIGTNFGGGTPFSYNNGTIAGNTYASTTVKHTNGKTYFATLDTDGTILPLTSMIPLPASGSSNTNNYSITGAYTAVGAPNVNTLRIEPSAAGQAMDLGGRAFALSRQAIILDGSNDYAITNGVFSSPVAFIVAGTGKLTVGATLYNTSLYSMTKLGQGMLELTGPTNSSQGGNSYLYGGVMRVGAETALTCSNLLIGAGVLEVGYDFTRTVGTGAGQVVINGGGFSTYGGDHYVNLGGAGAMLLFNAVGGGSFVITRDGRLVLSSSTSDGTIDFRNPLNLNAEHQSIEVGNGSAIVDAILSGTLTNGGLIKTGAGTLSLTGANTHGLGTVVGAGTLLANNAAGSATGTGSVTVCSSATLGGSGTLAPGTSNLVWIGGTLAPGAGTSTNTAGTTLSIDLAAASSKVQLAAGATCSCKIGASATADQVRFLNCRAGALTFNGNVVNVTHTGTVSPGEYTLMTFYSDNGVTLTDNGKPLSGLVLGTAPTGFSTQIDYSQTGKIALQVARYATMLLIR